MKMQIGKPSNDPGTRPFSFLFSQYKLIFYSCGLHELLPVNIHGPWQKQRVKQAAARSRRKPPLLQPRHSSKGKRPEKHLLPQADHQERTPSDNPEDNIRENSDTAEMSAWWDPFTWSSNISLAVIDLLVAIATALIFGVPP